MVSYVGYAVLELDWHLDAYINIMFCSGFGRIRQRNACLEEKTKKKKCMIRIRFRIYKSICQRL